jgi:phosphate transport system protein
MIATRQRFSAALDDLRADLLRMGFDTEAMLQDAVSALVHTDIELAEAIIRRDDVIDRMEEQVEERCLRVFALQQPVLASDLRLVSTILKVATDIERIGDHTVNIARTSQRLVREGAIYRPLVDVPRLAEMTRAMLHDALEAIVHHDVDQAERVIAADEQVDALYARMRRDLQCAMANDPTAVIAASCLMFVIHYLERISDHCTNIAERLLFLETGQRRHEGHEESK